MNVKKFQHPVTKEYRETRDLHTATALKAQGWREVQTQATVTAGEGAKK